MSDRAGAPPSGLVLSLLRAEGGAAFVASVFVWGALSGNWLAFALLLLVPDLSALGYLGGPRLGAVTYNLAHNWATALVLLGAGWWLQVSSLVLAGVLLAAHVGADRLFGYGLKYPTAFTDTHLGPIGRARGRP